MNVTVIHADILRLVEQSLAVTFFLGGSGHILQLRDGRAPGFGRDRRQQVQVGFTVARLDAPGNDALTLPAHVGFDVVGAPQGRIDMHDV